MGFVCITFAANYDWSRKDSNRQRIYRNLGKIKLINHKLFDLAKEDQREDYFYSLPTKARVIRCSSSLVLLLAIEVINLSKDSTL